jgi:tetratricopeptide (TPR) repeat protein
MTVARHPVRWWCVAAVLVWLTTDGRAAAIAQAPTQGSSRDRARSAPAQLIDELSTLLEEGQVTVVKTRVGEALRRYPSDAALHDIAGAVAAQQGSYGEAERHFRAAIERDSRLLSAYLNLGRLYQEHTRDDRDAPAKALAVYRSLLKIDPENNEALFQAGYLSACSGDWRFSRTLLERLPTSGQSRPQVLVLLATDLAGVGEPLLASEATDALLRHPDLTEDDIVAALPALDRLSDDAFSEQLLEGLDARHAASAESLQRLGVLQMRLGHLDRAAHTLARAAEAVGSPTAPLLLDMARVAYKQKEFERALGYIAHARDLDPQNAEVHFFFGLTCVELNLGSEAYEALKKAVALAPDNPFVNYALGAVAIHRHEPSEALPYFENYVRLRPIDPRGRFALGAAKFYSNMFDAARLDLERAVQAPETAAGAHYFLGRIARQSNELETAQAEIDRALQADPQYVDALAELGLLQTRRGEYEAAERSLGRALEIDPDNYAATVNLTALYTRTRDPRREAQAVRLDEMQQKRAVSAQEFLRIVHVVQ